jgi:hypothetical protein
LAFERDFSQNPIPVSSQVHRGQDSFASEERGERMAPKDTRSADILALIRGQGWTVAVPLPQLVAVDDSTAEAIADWHYSVSQGYCF